jgi:hypothetical protein
VSCKEDLQKRREGLFKANRNKAKTKRKGKTLMGLAF